MAKPLQTTLGLSFLFSRCLQGLNSWLMLGLVLPVVKCPLQLIWTGTHHSVQLEGGPADLHQRQGKEQEFLHPSCFTYHPKMVSLGPRLEVEADPHCRKHPAFLFRSPGRAWRWW